MITKMGHNFNPGELYNANKSMMAQKKMKYKNWIAGAIKKPGALHKELGVAQGKKIPASRLAKAASKGGKLGKRARLAETLKSFHHKKGKMKNKMTEKQDKVYDKKHGIKEGSKKDIAQDKKMGVKMKKKVNFGAMAGKAVKGVEKVGGLIGNMAKAGVKNFIGKDAFTKGKKSKKK